MEILALALFVLVPAIVAFIGAYLIKLVVRKQLARAGNKHTKSISWTIAIVSYLMIFVAIICLLAYNFRLER